MKQHVRHLIWFIVLVGLSSGTAVAALTYTLSVMPSSGTIQGSAGSTIGWGYSITNNDNSDWLVPTDLTSDPFLNATPNSSLFDFPIIAPGATVSLAYDAVANTGLFAITWNTTAPAGFTNSGVFTLDAQWWSGDPLTNGTFVQNAQPLTAPYSATVSSTTTPEPRSFFLSLIAICSIFVIRRRASIDLVN